MNGQNYTQKLDKSHRKWEALLISALLFVMFRRSELISITFLTFFISILNINFSLTANQKLIVLSFLVILYFFKPSNILLILPSIFISKRYIRTSLMIVTTIYSPLIGAAYFQASTLDYILFTAARIYFAYEHRDMILLGFMASPLILLKLCNFTPSNYRLDSLRSAKVIFPPLVALLPLKFSYITMIYLIMFFTITRTYSKFDDIKTWRRFLTLSYSKVAFDFSALWFKFQIFSLPFSFLRLIPLIFLEVPLLFALSTMPSFIYLPMAIYFVLISSVDLFLTAFEGSRYTFTRFPALKDYNFKLSSKSAETAVIVSVTMFFMAALSHFVFGKIHISDKGKEMIFIFLLFCFIFSLTVTLPEISFSDDSNYVVLPIFTNEIHEFISFINKNI